ncbi:hypothetical protein F5B17DRAFT_400266 [Nemania serpens]|nr:hypothetical protein F5B17DRAFT_400266 [Nemania serpens]
MFLINYMNILLPAVIIPHFIISKRATRSAFGRPCPHLTTAVPSMFIIALYTCTVEAILEDFKL